MEAAHPPPMGVTGPSIPSSHPFRKRYTFGDVWHAMASERDFDYVFWIHITLDLLFDRGIRYFGYVLVIVAMFLVTMLGSSGLFIVLPKVSRPGSLGYYAQVMIGKEPMPSMLFAMAPLSSPLILVYSMLSALLHLFQLHHGRHDETWFPSGLRTRNPTSHSSYTFCRTATYLQTM